MAVMAVRGDLRHLACRAWYLPGDVHRVIAWTWTHDDPVLDAGLAELRQQPLPAGWGVDGVRVEAVPLADKTRATPVHCAIPSGGTNEWNYHRETLRQFVDLALDLPDPQGITRARPLLAVPLIGTGFSSYQPSFDEHLRGLLDALEGETRGDFVIVVRGATEFAALQALRRQQPIDPEIAHLRQDVERLAAAVREGRLVLFTGAGISMPAGLPSWTQLLSTVADEVLPPDTTKAFAELHLLDQASLLDDRMETGTLVARIAARMSTKQYAITHSLLANFPVRENVTLNYDKLLEAAADDAGRPLSVLPYEPAGDAWLLKLHGDISEDRRSDIVLTRSHYLSVSGHRASLSGIVQALLVTRHMLFVGFGFGDDHLHQVVHDVRRAVGDAKREDKLGTALVLEHDDMQQQLWGRDLNQVAMLERGSTEGASQAARRIELFLDAVLLNATSSESYLFDPRFAGLLTEQEAVLRDAFVDTFRGKRMPESPAWARTQRLLADLGWRN